MARPPQLSLRKEDFPDLQPDKLDKFFRMVNAFATDVRSALSRGLTDTDNAVASLREVTITADGNGKITALSLAHGLPGSARPKVVTIAQAFTVNSSSKAQVPAALYGPAWTEGDGKVAVSDIGGLAAGATYRIVFLIKG